MLTLTAGAAGAARVVVGVSMTTSVATKLVDVAVNEVLVTAVSELSERVSTPLVTVTTVRSISSSVVVLVATGMRVVLVNDVW